MMLLGDSIIPIGETIWVADFYNGAIEYFLNYAHCLTTIQNTDRIVVLDRRCIIEQGKHQELLTFEGLYSHL